MLKSKIEFLFHTNSTTDLGHFIMLLFIFKLSYLGNYIILSLILPYYSYNTYNHIIIYNVYYLYKYIRVKLLECKELKLVAYINITYINCKNLNLLQ